MKQDYETLFILTPVLSEDQMKNIAGKFKKIINSNGGKIINEEYWGLKKLAYPIQRKTTGFYCLFEFKADTSLIKKLETEYKREETVMRFLTVSLDKFALAYNEKRKTGAFNKKEEPKKEAIS